jgi:Bacterial Ig-like domain (group 2)
VQARGEYSLLQFLHPAARNLRRSAPEDTYTVMSSKRSNRRLIGAFTLLAALALAASCNGFFVDPTLTAVSVGPQGLTLTVNQQFQMSATGTYSPNGSQKTLTSGVTWSSSDPTTVSVGQTSGIATGVQVGQATITAAAGSCSACSGSTTVTVVLTGVTSVVVTPSNQSVTAGNSVYFTAKANGATDITNAGATWTVIDSGGADQTSNFSIAFVSGLGEGFTPASGIATGPYTVEATYNGIVGKATLNVN